MRGEHPPVAWSAGAYGRLAVAVAAVAALLSGIGAALAWLLDDGSLPAVLAAVGATALASLLSGIALAFAGGPPTARLNRALLAMLVRLALVAGLAAVGVLVLEVPRRPFLIWLVASYLALLAVDTIFSVRRAR